MMSEGATMELDSTSLGNGAAVAGVSPAGILNGVALPGPRPRTHRARISRLTKDIEILVNALAANGGWRVAGFHLFAGSSCVDEVACWSAF